VLSGVIISKLSLWSLFHTLTDKYSGDFEMTGDARAFHKTGDCSLAVPMYRQLKSYTCGFVAAAMVVRTFHEKKSLKRIWEQVTPDFDWGVQTHALVRGLRKLGIGVSVKHDLNFSQVQKSIEDGFPIIATVQRKGMGHWVVIYGVNKNSKEILIAASGIAYISRHRYTWKEFKQMEFRDREFLICWGK
jgi:ABC-type bacteriocin/lantibiotic exporter with double-glycine peptidase domain